MGVPKNRWFTVENPIQMDDVRVPPILGNFQMKEIDGRFQSCTILSCAGISWMVSHVHVWCCCLRGDAKWHDPICSPSRVMFFSAQWSMARHQYYLAWHYNLGTKRVEISTRMLCLPLFQSMIKKYSTLRWRVWSPVPDILMVWSENHLRIVGDCGTLNIVCRFHTIRWVLRPFFFPQPNHSLAHLISSMASWKIPNLVRRFSHWTILKPPFSLF